MFPGWVIATLFAAAFQTWRTALQQRLRGLLSPNAAGFVRYAFGAPWAIGAVLCIALAGWELPALNVRFLLVIAVGGVAQIVGTNLLIRSFALRDFAIGTAFSKTEAIQVAVISVAVLGEPVSWRAWVGITVSLVGVTILATKGDRSQLRTLWSTSPDAGMWAGIGAGTGFAVAAVCIRSASQSLGSAQPIVRALITLAVMNTIQTLLNGVWLAAADRTQFGAIRKLSGASAAVGLLSVLGSAGWAIGMTLQNAALVRALGQIDLVFAFVVAKVLFHEERRPSEYLGSALVVAGVVLVLLR
jgi:drug/metabolite transporter (DMT)-like permease